MYYLWGDGEEERLEIVGIGWTKRGDGIARGRWICNRDSPFSPLILLSLESH